MQLKWSDIGLSYLNRAPNWQVTFFVIENAVEKSVAVLEKDAEDEKKVGTAIDIQKTEDDKLTIEEAKGDAAKADMAIKSFEKTGEFYDELYYD